MAYLKDGEPLICYTFYKCLCQAPRDDQVGSISAHVAQTLPTCGVLHVCTCARVARCSLTCYSVQNYG